jgi:hypothetical protein
MEHDFDRLGDRIIPYATNAITADGFLVPISAVVSPDGEVIPVTFIQPPREGADAPELVAENLKALRKIAGSKHARAVAWCVDMRVIPPGASAKTDALVVFFESAAGEAVALVMPYHGAPGPGTKFGEAYRQRTQPEIFGAPAP